MDSRDQENDKIDLEEIYEKSIKGSHKSGEGFQERAVEKLDAANFLLNHQLLKEIDKLGIKGNQCQIRQQSALVVHFFILTLAIFLSMIISEISFLGQVWTFVPGFFVSFVAIYLLCLLLVQYQQEATSQPRWNFAVGLLHAVAKIAILIYLSIYLFDIRLEVLLMVVDLATGHVWFKIYLPTQRGEASNLSILYHWKSILVFQLFTTSFLVLLVREDLLQWFLVLLCGLLYTFYLLLCLQRFTELRYLNQNQNDLYLGAVQIDAEMFLPCKLIVFHINSLENPTDSGSQNSQRSNKAPLQQQAESNQLQQQNEERRIQSEKSIQGD